MTQRLSDQDVERIARRVVEKLVIYLLVILAAVYLVPLLFFPLLSAMGYITRGLPSPLAVAITASVIAAPLVTLIFVRSRRAR